MTSSHSKSGYKNLSAAVKQKWTQSQTRGGAQDGQAWRALLTPLLVVEESDDDCTRQMPV